MDRRTFIHEIKYIHFLTKPLFCAPSDYNRGITTKQLTDFYYYEKN